jgi:hypothetical protein
MVTRVAVATVGAVNTPEELMEPALALQVTPVLKFPVPVIAAVQVLIPPETTVEGEQLGDTETMVEFEEPPLLLPQAANHMTFASNRNNPNLRTLSP